jgi:peroxiredoxin
VLSDPGAQVADAYGVGYTVPESHRDYYQGILVNIPFVNSGAMYNNATEESWRLPVPAVFVIRRDGTVAFSKGYADFRVRPEPAEVLESLDSLATLDAI